jgi:hypothetical protein
MFLPFIYLSPAIHQNPPSRSQNYWAPERFGVRFLVKAAAATESIAEVEGKQHLPRRTAG